MLLLIVDHDCVSVYCVGVPFPLNTHCSPQLFASQVDSLVIFAVTEAFVSHEDHEHGASQTTTELVSIVQSSYSISILYVHGATDENDHELLLLTVAQFILR